MLTHKLVLARGIEPLSHRFTVGALIAIEHDQHDVRGGTSMFTASGKALP
jgi:hypothetical protein